jgi:integrase/recombinase XerC
MQIQDEALASFTTQLWADGKAALTIAQRCRHVRAFLGWLQDEELADVTPAVVARFFAQPCLRTRTPGTINTLKTSVRAFLAFLHQTGALPEDPARLIRRAMCGPPPPRGLSTDERERLEAVLAEAPLRDRVLFRLMLHAGLRLGSALALNAEDIDLARGTARLRSAKGRRDLTAHLPRILSEELCSLLADRPTGPLFVGPNARRITPRHVQRLFTGYAHDAGLSLSNTHALRHTFAMTLYERTGDVLLVQKALHHRHLESTMVYAHADDRRLREALGG